ncbi:hypothetical protein BDQ17DRAFT_1212315, partial [Cyathus striatus]
RFKRAEFSRCEECWEQLHITACETVNYFLFECPAYAVERHNMNRKLGRNARNFGYLM